MNVLGSGEDYWTKVLFCTGTLAVMTIICLIGADCFGKIGCCIFLFLMTSLVATVISFSFLEAASSMYSDMVKKGYSGWRWDTFTDNLLPYSESQQSIDDVFEAVVRDCSIIKNATTKEVIFDENTCNYTSPEVIETGSYYVDVETNERLNFQLIFGVLFPACTGAMAGANLSGDLANPSWSIPVGTISATFFTYIIYVFLIVMFGATTTKSALVSNYNITSEVSFLPILISIGIFAATISSGLTSIIGGSRILSALAKDNVFPFLGWFSIDVGWPTKEPRFAVLLTALLTQGLIFMPSIGTIAPFVTQFFMVAYCFVNFACFALAITEAPNFRPTFKFYTWWISLCGVILCLVFMFVLDYIKAIAVFFVILVIIVVISCYAKPKPWGDIVTAIMYSLGKRFQNRIARKNEHIKYWRLRSLALIGHPKSYFRLIRLLDDICRHKGGLLILGTVKTGKYRERIEHYRRDKAAFQELLEESHLKVFFNITFAKRVRKGIQNLILNSGFGGMEPDVVFIPLYDYSEPSEEDDGLKGIKNIRGSSTSHRRVLSSANFEVSDSEEPTEKNKESKPVKFHGRVLSSLEKFSPEIDKLSRSRTIHEAFVLEKSPTLNQMSNESGSPTSPSEDESAGGFTLTEYMKSLVDILLIKKGLVITTGIQNLDREKCKPKNIFHRVTMKKLFTVDLWIVHGFGTPSPATPSSTSKSSKSSKSSKKSSKKKDKDKKKKNKKNKKKKKKKKMKVEEELDFAEEEEEGGENVKEKKNKKKRKNENDKELDDKDTDKELESLESSASEKDGDGNVLDVLDADDPTSSVEEDVLDEDEAEMMERMERNKSFYSFDEDKEKDDSKEDSKEDKDSDKDSEDSFDPTTFIFDQDEGRQRRRELSPENQRSLSLMFQLASLLLASSIWRKFHRLRVCVIVDGNSSKDEVKRVKGEVKNLLQLIRIKRLVKNIEIVPVDTNMLREFLKEEDLDLDMESQVPDMKHKFSPEMISPEARGVEISRNEIEQRLIDQGDVEMGSNSNSDSDSLNKLPVNLQEDEGELPEFEIIYDEDGNEMGENEGGEQLEENESSSSSSSSSSSENEEEAEEDGEMSPIDDILSQINLEAVKEQQQRRKRRVSDGGQPMDLLRVPKVSFGGVQRFGGGGWKIRNTDNNKMGLTSSVSMSTGSGSGRAFGVSNSEIPIPSSIVHKSRTFSSFNSLRSELSKNQEKLEFEFTMKKKKSIHVDLGRSNTMELTLEDEGIPEFRIGKKALTEQQQMTFLNRIIKKHTNDNSSIVFLTLPHPPSNFETEEAHLEYYRTLRALTDRLPPTFLVYSKVNVISTML